MGFLARVRLISAAHVELHEVSFFDVSQKLQGRGSKNVGTPGMGHEAYVVVLGHMGDPATVSISLIQERAWFEYGLLFATRLTK